MNVEAELVDGIWMVRETDEDGTQRSYPITCEIAVYTGKVAQGAKVIQTCGKPAGYRAITGAGDGSGQNYDERFCCADCKAADEESGKLFKNGVLVEDYGPMYQYELITLEWLNEEA